MLIKQKMHIVKQTNKSWNLKRDNLRRRAQVVNYKIVNGTAYYIDTPQEVIEILEEARKKGERIRIFYGDKDTGRDWNEEYDVLGYIGRSAGRFKVPLLIKNKNSLSGCAILTNCIVKITLDKRIIYQHKKYHCGDFVIKATDENLMKSGYTHSVYRDGINIANFKSLNKAKNYISFMKGERNRI